MRVWAIATAIAWLLGGAVAAADLIWTVPRLHGLQDLTLAAGIAGIIWRWTHRDDGLEFRAGYWQGRADEAQARTRVQARD